MKKVIRLLLLGNLPIVRAGLRALIDAHDDLTVIAEAPAADKLLKLNGHERPDVVLLDCDPDAADTLDLLSELSQSEATIPIVLLADSQDRDFQERAIKLGARGQVSKYQTPEVLFKAIQRVHAGEISFERVVMASALKEMSRKNGTKETSDEAVRIGTLSKREREVVVLIGEGLKNKQIADRLFISETTVQHHLSITATYNGDANFTGSTSTALIQTVVVPISSESVKVNGGGFITLATRGNGSFGLVGMVSKTDVASGDVEYQDHDAGLNIKSTTITAVVVTGNHARMFGTATVNGAGSFDFVVDVDDLGEPGAGVDKFQIQLSNGYTAGAALISGGNIQVHN